MKITTIIDYILKVGITIIYVLYSFDRMLNAVDYQFFGGELMPFNMLDAMSLSWLGLIIIYYVWKDDG